MTTTFQDIITVISLQPSEFKSSCSVIMDKENVSIDVN